MSSYSLRRSIPAKPSTPEPNSIMLLGSGTVPPVVLVLVPIPRIVNASEGTVFDRVLGSLRRSGVLVPINRIPIVHHGILQVQPVGTAFYSRKKGAQREPAAEIPKRSEGPRTSRSRSVDWWPLPDLNLRRFRRRERSESLLPKSRSAARDLVQADLARSIGGPCRT